MWKRKHKRISTWTTHKFHIDDFFEASFSSVSSREARTISVHRTASCSSIRRSLYWLRSSSTRAISNRVKRFRSPEGTFSYKISIREMWKYHNWQNHTKFSSRCVYTTVASRSVISTHSFYRPNRRRRAHIGIVHVVWSLQSVTVLSSSHSFHTDCQNNFKFSYADNLNCPLHSGIEKNISHLRDLGPHNLIRSDPIEKSPVSLFENNR